MDNEIQIQEEIYSSDNGSFRVSKAIFNSEPCYTVQNFHKGEIRTVVFDNDERIMRSVICRMNRTKMSRDNKGTGSKFMFKFKRGKREPGISLRNYLWGKYNGISPKKAKKIKVELTDKSTYTDNIMDMRRENMYDAGGTNTEGISIISHIISGEQFIMVQFDDRIEVLEYTPEMYQMLTTRKICSRCRKSQRGRNSGRLNTTIRFGDGKHGRVIKNLSRFVLLYDEHFKRFRNYRHGSIRRFTHSIPSIDPKEREEQIDCGHLNALSWNNCNENVLFMKKKLNNEMSTYARQIAGKYSMLPIAWKSDDEIKILIEWNAGEALCYFVCESVADYLDFQKTVLGKNQMISNLSLFGVDENGNWVQYKTPMQSAVPERENDVLSESALKTELWRWCSGRDRVLELYRRTPGVFWIWRNTEHDVEPTYLARQILRVMGIPA